MRVAVFVVVVEAVPGLLWAGMYLVLGLPFAAAIPGGFALITVGNMLLCYAMRWGNAILPIHLGLIIMLPFALEVTLGGIVASGYVVMWCIVAPLTALIVRSPRESIGWFAAFACAISVAVAFDPAVHPASNSFTQLSRAFLWLNTLGVASLVFGTLIYCNLQVLQAHAESERLLLNVLPEPIARRLKANGHEIADRFDDVCVIFADIVNFTRLCENSRPQEVVGLLNRVFSTFDDLAERFGLEKIKTIGDAYMVASGIPTPHRDHIGAAVEMALAMQESVEQLSRTSAFPIQLHVGMHSGPVVAGVIGKRKFIYDLWGDTVNIASRMESYSAPGTIQLTESLAKRIGGRYPCEPVGVIDIKGKGPMAVYRLVPATGGGTLTAAR